jgi:hypothetical protein
MHRRDVLRNAATGVAGLAAGYHLMHRSTTDAAAAVSLGTLDVSGDDVTTDDGTISALTASVSGQWEYALPSGANPDRWEVTLVVADSDAQAAVLLGATGHLLAHLDCVRTGNPATCRARNVGAGLGVRDEKVVFDLPATNARHYSHLASVADVKYHSVSQPRRSWT